MCEDHDLVDELVDEGAAEDPAFARLVEEARPVVRAQTLLTMLANYREQQGRTQAWVAERLGTTQSAVARLERPAENASLVTVCRYAAVLGYTLELASTA